MTKGASIVLIVYSLSMLCYGVLEMTHDFLHYLSAQNISHVHTHRHDQRHTFHDHEHSHRDHHEHVSHTHTDSEDSGEETLPSLINFFLFSQRKPEFRFHNTQKGSFAARTFLHAKDIFYNPPTPPPEYLMG